MRIEWLKIGEEQKEVKEELEFEYLDSDCDWVDLLQGVIKEVFEIPNNIHKKYVYYYDLRIFLVIGNDGVIYLCREKK